MFVGELLRIAPKEPELRAFVETVKQCLSADPVNVETEKKAIERAHEDLLARRARVKDMREEGALDRTEFDLRIAKVEIELAENRVALNTLRPIQRTQALTERVIVFLKDLAKTWCDLHPKIIARFEKLILPNGIPYHRKDGVGTYEVGPIFNLVGQSEADLSRLVTQPRVFWNRIFDDFEELDSLLQELEVKEQKPQPGTLSL